jgi:hypothetical protein
MEELTIPYNIQFVEFSDVKKEDYTRINPNGRLPAIQDPNTNLTLWEVGRIIPIFVDVSKTDIFGSLELSLNTWSTNTTQMARSLTKCCPRSTLPNSGLLFRYQVSHRKQLQARLLSDDIQVKDHILARQPGLLVSIPRSFRLLSTVM